MILIRFCHGQDEMNNSSNGILSCLFIVILLIAFAVVEGTNLHTSDTNAIFAIRGASHSPTIVPINVCSDSGNDASHLNPSFGNQCKNG